MRTPCSTRALGRALEEEQVAGPTSPHVLELLGDGRDLLHAVLVGRQVAFKGLVLPQQGPDFCQRRRLVILLQQDLLFACKGCGGAV